MPIITGRSANALWVCRSCFHGLGVSTTRAGGNVHNTCPRKLCRRCWIWMASCWFPYIGACSHCRCMIGSNRRVRVLAEAARLDVEGADPSFWGNWLTSPTCRKIMNVREQVNLAPLVSSLAQGAPPMTTSGLRVIWPASGFFSAARRGSPPHRGQSDVWALIEIGAELIFCRRNDVTIRPGIWRQPSAAHRQSRPFHRRFHSFARSRNPALFVSLLGRKMPTEPTHQEKDWFRRNHRL